MSEEAAQTSLKVMMKGWEIEVSVNMKKIPLKVYQETKTDKQTVCWIASEAGKAYSVTLSATRNGPLDNPEYDHSEARVMIDGVDATHVRQWFFSQPRLDEEGGLSQTQAVHDLGAIVIEVYRSRPGRTVTAPTYRQVKDTGAISEKTKKGILGAVTTFKEKESAVNPLRVRGTSIRQPEDHKNPMWSFRFNYAPQAVLQAQGRISFKHNIAQGEAGLSSTAPIELDDEPGPSVRSAKENKPKIVNKRDANEPDATEAALIAALERHRAMKRKQSATSIELSEDEDDSKPEIARHISKRLRIKREQDGGKVDLTLDSD